MAYSYCIVNVTQIPKGYPFRSGGNDFVKGGGSNVAKLSNDNTGSFESVIFNPKKIVGVGPNTARVLGFSDRKK